MKLYNFLHFVVINELNNGYQLYIYIYIYIYQNQAQTKIENMQLYKMT
jgi:hypothetical protein